MLAESSRHAKVAANNPLLALEYFAALMKHTVCAVPMQQRKAYFKVHSDWFRQRTFALFSGRVGIEDSLTADATGSGRGKVKQQRPGSPGLSGWCTG